MKIDFLSIYGSLLSEASGVSSDAVQLTRIKTDDTIKAHMPF